MNHSIIIANVLVGYINNKIMHFCNYCRLSFRSMGILLPPVTQVTTANTTHLTSHHRNRSLDSALQRIPEVDITPSPECEATVVSVLASEPLPKVSKNQRDELASLGSDDSGILCGSDSGSSGSSDSNATRESSVEQLTSAVLNREALPCSVLENQCAKSDIVMKDDGETNCEKDQPSETKDVSEVKAVSASIDPSEVKPTKDLLLRLLESKMFDVTMAIPYLFQSKEHGVQSYIANKMFSYPDSEVDFYLPQLVCMYIQMHDVAETIHPYLVHR